MSAEATKKRHKPRCFCVFASRKKFSWPFEFCNLGWSHSLLPLCRLELAAPPKTQFWSQGHFSQEGSRKLAILIESGNSRRQSCSWPPLLNGKYLRYCGSISMWNLEQWYNAVSVPTSQNYRQPSESFCTNRRNCLIPGCTLHASERE